jgi:hypothetical protein
MVSIGNSVRDFKQLEFRTERIEAQKIVPGDMVLFENDFLEVKITGHRIVDRQEGQDIWTLPGDNKRTVHIDFIFEPDVQYQPGRRPRQSEHKMGDKVVRLRDTTDEPKQAMLTDADARAAKGTLKDIIAHLNVLGDEDWWDKVSEGMTDKQVESLGALGEIVKDHTED